MFGHRYKTTNASARPAITERNRKPITDTAVFVLTGVRVSACFIPVSFCQIEIEAGILLKPVLIDTILSANRLSRMVRFGKIVD